MATVTQKKLPIDLQRGAALYVNEHMLARARELDQRYYSPNHEYECAYLAQFAMPVGYERYNRAVGQHDPCADCIAEIYEIMLASGRRDLLSRYHSQFAPPLPDPAYGICATHLPNYLASVPLSSPLAKEASLDRV